MRQKEGRACKWGVLLSKKRLIALDPNEDQGEFDDFTSNGFARYAWAPFEFPEVPRVHITGPSPDSVMNLWCIDTGANVPVTFPGAL